MFKNLFLDKEVFREGYKFSETELLTYPIVLLGATLSISTIMGLGIGGIVFIAIQMVVIIVGGTLQSIGIIVASGAMVNETTKNFITIFKILRVILYELDTDRISIYRYSIKLEIIALASIGYRVNFKDLLRQGKKVDS